MPKRSGLLAAGNFIVDYVKLINVWPEQDTLATISSESRSNGGGAFNLLLDLVALGANFPLEACGLVGDDANGNWILESCQQAGINITQLAFTDLAPTSYTDAMTVASSGRRTFFHQRGANALFSEKDIDLSRSRAKLFYLSYIMLLDTLDELDAKGTTGLARTLQSAKAAGFITVSDCVSSSDPSFSKIARAALGHSDVFFVNEFEAGQILQRKVEANRVSMTEAGLELKALGCPGKVVIHAAPGACSIDATGNITYQGSIKLPQEFIKGATGAGDAFSAGYLFALHENKSEESCLRLAVCTAASSLAHPGASAGVQNAKACLALAETYGFRDF